MKERFFTFLLLVGSIGAIVVGVLVGGRLNELSTDALAWMGGSLFGCALMLLPLAVVFAAGWFALRWREARAERRPSYPQQPQPPVVIVTGGQLAAPSYPATSPLPTSPAAEWQRSHEARQYTILGED